MGQGEEVRHQEAIRSWLTFPFLLHPSSMLPAVLMATKYVSWDNWTKLAHQVYANSFQFICVPSFNITWLLKTFVKTKVYES